MSVENTGRTSTVYVSVGNSDDKLSQVDWSRYVAEVFAATRVHGVQTFGEWWSSPGSIYQNACTGFLIPDDPVGRRHLQDLLTKIRTRFGQDSLAWVQCDSATML